MRCTFARGLLLASLLTLAGCLRASFAPRGREDAARADHAPSELKDSAARPERSETALDSASCPALPRAPIANNRLSWKGYPWLVDDYQGTQFYNDRVWVDCHDKLHIVLRYANSTWHALNVIKEDGAKYGTFTTTVETDLGKLQNANPHLLFSIFTHDNTLTAAPWNNGELLIELSNNGVTELDANVVWIISVAPAFTQQSSIKGPNVTHVLEWLPAHIKFSAQGPEHPYSEWVHEDVGTIPPEQAMSFLYYVGQWDHTPPPGGATSYTAEVVLSDFRYVAP